MNCRFIVIKFRKLIVGLFIALMLIYVAYVCYSVFFSGYSGRFI